MPDQDNAESLQKKIEALTAELTECNAKIASQETIIADLTEKREQENAENNQEKAEVIAELTECKATIALQETTIADLKEKNERLLSMASRVRNEPAAAESPKRTKPVVNIDGENYRFRFGAFAFEGVRYEAKDLALNEDLLRKIIATEGQSILKQIF